MECPSCGQPTEETAAYCGNCGQPLAAGSMAKTYDWQSDHEQPRGTHVARTALANADGVPLYAIAAPDEHRGEVKATLSVAFGVIGLVGALFVAAAGLGAGLTGLVLATMSRSVRKHRAVSNVGLSVSCLAILFSLATWSYVVTHARAAQSAQQASARQREPVNDPVPANSVTTPCYSAGFSTELNIATTDKSCDMQAFDGKDITNSSTAYKVYAYDQPSMTAASFAGIAKSALEKDVQANLSGFTLDSENVGQFAGSPSYTVYASDKSHEVAYVEAAVLHQTAGKANLFIFVHAVAGERTDLSGIEAEWLWR
jgi:hypothetical protein